MAWTITVTRLTDGPIHRIDDRFEHGRALKRRTG
jgi:hypothetical protein